ncbi:MAG: hypothetical protein RIB45_02180 [Marivibrio sp.]|uniref:hypothetical protein n=1 Tax=Marivibrio sp. TaxID=2039719 RepID=UPI0032F0047A
MTQHYNALTGWGARAPHDARGQEMRELLHAAQTGALIGAAGAAAVHLHRMRDGGTTMRAAAADMAKAGATVAAANTAATAVARTLGGGPVVSLLTALATGAAVTYALTETPKAEEGR